MGPVIWALLLAVPASWGVGLGLARLIDRQSNMLPAITILAALAVLAAVACIPWSAASVRLKLMQALAAFGVALMLAMA